MSSRTSFLVGAIVALAGCGGGEEEQTPARTTPARTTHFSLNHIDLVDLTVKAAEAKLRAAGWSIRYSSSEEVGYEPYEVSLPEDPKWIVCSQRSSKLENGTNSLDVEAAPTCGTVRMPNLVGMSYADADKAVAKLGLVLLEDHSAFGPDAAGGVGAICTQSLAPGPFVRAEVDDPVYVELGC